MKKYAILIALSTLFFACDEGWFSDSGDSSAGTGGSMARFACIGNHLYVVDDTYLQTFDISDSSKISLTSRIEGSWGFAIETIFPKDSLLFLGSTNGMYIYNLKRPSVPEYVSQIQHFTSCDPVVVQGAYAYVTLRTGNELSSCSRGVNQLQVIDISNLNAPITKSVFSMVNPKGLAIDGNLLFVCDGMDLAVLDVTDPLLVTEKNRFELDGTPYDVIAKNGILILSYSSGLKQYSYSNGNIQEISTLY
jgi:hypothetical protein